MTSNLLLFAVFVVSMLLMSVNYQRRRKKVVFFGDSITLQAVGDLGYINQLRHLLQESLIDEKYELVGAGVWGDQVYDLFLRVEEDVLAKGADIVVLFIGINDVWDKYAKLTGTDIDKFETFYTAIIKKLQSAAIKVVLCTPTVVGEQTPFLDKINEDIDRYSDVIRTLSIKYELPLVDLRKAFVTALMTANIEFKEQGVLTTDKVHLNSWGNKLVAEEMWEILKQIK